MKHGLPAIFILLLSGCSPRLGIPPQPPGPTSASLPTLTFPLSPLPPTLTPFPSQTNNETILFTPSATPTESWTPTLTGTSTETPISWSYVFPVQPSGGADFVEGLASHGYPATDIFAPKGSRFVAVTNGVVDFVSYEDLWEPVMDAPALRGGLSVTIIGDDGVRYYGSHLFTIQPGIRPGDRVKAGQVLGQVGNTGDALNSPPHLHFGVSHPTQPDDWRVRRGEVDPFPFLIAWREGHNVTPNLVEISMVPSTGITSQSTYVFPVQPVKNVSFGDGGHGYPATDIFAPAGSQFVAVTGGVVDNVSYEDRWDPATIEAGLSGGLWVSILGDDGIRYYGAHLSAVASGIRVGARVRGGDLLGLIGNSGDARGTLSHLHFEISNPASASEWMSRDGLIDPFPFLQAWKAGQYVTPPRVTP